MRSPSRPLSPWQLFYGWVHKIRRRHHRRRAHRLPRPVVSVGNLHWGGAGKTPLVAALAHHLRDRGLRVAILSRGYRGPFKKAGEGVRLVSDGRGPLLGPSLAGDEPVLLAEQLPGVAVLVGADRYAAGIQAIERLDPPPDLFLLDDGFSHVQLQRDLDLLAFPASDPFAGGRLPPGGRLREPLASSRWAHAALLTGASDESADDLRQALEPHGFRGAAFTCRTRVDPPQAERHEALPVGARVVLVTGIARPERVARSVSGLPVEVVGSLTFPDHHDYPEDSLQRIQAARKETGAEWVLTTAKDHVKLLGRLEAPLAVLPVRADPEPAFWEWLDQRVTAAGGGA